MKQPLFISRQGARLEKRGERIVICDREGNTCVFGFKDISHLVILGNVDLTLPCTQTLMQRHIPIYLCATNGHCFGHYLPDVSANHQIRRAQYAMLEAPSHQLLFAKAVLRAKFKSARALMQIMVHPETVEKMHQSLQALETAESVEQAMGYEGAGARVYFTGLKQVLAKGKGAWAAERFEGRHKRPPPDPFNACLSLAYTILSQHCLAVLLVQGVDETIGYLHKPWRTRPSLAFDLMEPYRPALADRYVLRWFERGLVTAEDFVDKGQLGLRLKEEARKRFVQGFHELLYGQHGSIGDMSQGAIRPLWRDAGMIGNYVLHPSKAPVFHSYTQKQSFTR